MLAWVCIKVIYIIKRPQAPAKPVYKEIQHRCTFQALHILLYDVLQRFYIYVFCLARMMFGARLEIAGTRQSKPRSAANKDKKN